MTPRHWDEIWFGTTEATDTITYLSFSWGHGPLDSLGAAHGLCLRVVLIAILGPWSELRDPERGDYILIKLSSDQVGRSSFCVLCSLFRFSMKQSSDLKGDHVLLF